MKKINLLLLLSVLLLFPLISAGNFTFVVETNATATSFDFYTGNAANLTVDWGDGNITGYNGTGHRYHNYTSTGLHNISLNGYLERLGFGDDGTTPTQLRDILTNMSDGLTGIKSGQYMFRNCKNITSFTEPHFFDVVSENVTSLNSMFTGATNFNGDISTWNTSNVGDMNFLFYSATSFNQNLSNWDTHNVTSMQNMFRSATSFNQPLNSWNTSKVTDMQNMFLSATNFNQSLSNWDTSKVTTMSGMFDHATNFNGNISTWNTSSLVLVSYMFNYASSFNQPLNNWDTSNINSFYYMFAYAGNFSQNLSNWNTSKVENMQDTFALATSFNGNISTWDTSKVTTMASMFQSASSFNQPIGSWNVSSVTSMISMFWAANSFNQPLNSWNTRSLTNMDYIFYQNTKFNQDLDNWNVSNVRSFAQVFYGATAFNGSVANWDTHNATSMYHMFSGALNFSRDVSKWNTSKVIDMSGLFYYSKFNGNLSSWDTHNVTSMSYMFGGTPFNQPVSNFNTSKVTNMQEMFRGTSFNQPLSNWDVSKVTNMQGMFYQSTAFDQDLGSWNVSSLTNGAYMFTNAKALSPRNYDSLLNGWLAHGVKNSVTFSGGNSKYTIIGNLSRYNLINTHLWIITDGGIYTDTTPPNLTLSNYTGLDIYSVLVQQNATDDYAIDSFWLNDTSTFYIDNGGLVFNISTVKQDNYNTNYSIRVYVNDSFNNIAYGDIKINIYKVLDKTIVINSPQNLTYYSSSIPIQITTSIDAELVIYNFEGINYTYTGVTSISPIDGSYTIIAYAYYPDLTMNSTSVDFSVFLNTNYITIGLNDCSIPNTNPLCNPIEQSHYSGTFNCLSTPNLTIVNGLITNVEC